MKLNAFAMVCALAAAIAGCGGDVQSTSISKPAQLAVSAVVPQAGAQAPAQVHYSETESPPASAVGR